MPDQHLTFGDVRKTYEDEHGNTLTRTDRARQEMKDQLAQLGRVSLPATHGATIKLEDKRFDAITQADVETIRKQRRTLAAHAPEAAKRVAEAKKAGQEPASADLAAVRPAAKRIAAAKKDKNEPAPEDIAAVRLANSTQGGEVHTNRLLARLRHLFSWAIKNGYTKGTPFKRDGVTVIDLNSDIEEPRERRLHEGEEQKLLDHAGPHLYAVIVGALETGMRRGELLSLTWADVRWNENAIYLPLKRTKTRKHRVIPISQRLKAVLDMRRLDPDGEELSASAFVFGNECGERIKSIKTAWKLTCKRAGVRGLRFHDLRRELASKLLETPGVSLIDVRDWLGHSNVTVTNTYLASTKVRLQGVLKKVEDARAAMSHGLPHAAETDAQKQTIEMSTKAVH
jgi:integrase